VALKRNERSAPPADFNYRRNRQRVDRPTNVFPPDQRYIYQDTAFPWCTVGRVDTPLGTCTGCTIGKRLLLTGDHCIQWNSDNTAGWVRFRPSYYNGSAPFGEAWATRVIFWQKNTPADGLSDQETAFDYVVCVLDRNMGDVVGYPGYRVYSDSWNDGSYWQHMGYPVDLSGAQRPAFQGSCVISSVGSKSASGQTGYVLGHFNDVVPGHSGGPVWGWWSGEPWPRVVGTQSAEASTPAMNTSGDNEFGGGPALSSLISWARSNYP
jgi:V8-like Glu-specific endopeptidase